MSTLKLHSPDLTAANIDRLAALFPNCVTESRDDKGQRRKAVDFDLLRQELSGAVVEGPVERYTLNWPGKRKAIVEANKPVYETLRPCEAESVNFATTKNLYIEGDNLKVLKLLQETYLGKIKMIYIDPPYNTGNDFIYDDDFAEDVETDLIKSSQKDAAGGRLVANLESNGRFHSDWLSMMYPRLKLARDLLREDGVIFISIDDSEIHNLRKLCDETLGATNFVGIFCRKTKSGGGSASDFCAIEHDYVMAYAKATRNISPLICNFSDSYLERYKEHDDIGPFFWDTMQRSSTKTRPYLIKAPDGTLLEGKWFRSEETFKKDLINGEVRFLKKADGWSVQFKQRLADGKKLRTILEESDLTDNKYRSLSQELENIVKCTLGHPPKPVELLKTLVFALCNKVGREEIILDFFSGSATTAHAVMQLNAEDNGDRRFIMIQLPEVCDEKSEAFKAGYKNICEIGKERIRRAAQKIKEENATNAPNLDVGFRVFKVDSSNMKDVYYTPDATEQSKLDLFADAIKEDRTAEDLLFQVFLDCGLDLALPVAKEKVAGKTVFVVDQNVLVACFASDISEPLIRELAKRKPRKAIFLDRSFAKDSTKLNVTQIFKQLSPNTKVKTL